MDNPIAAIFWATVRLLGQEGFFGQSLRIRSRAYSNCNGEELAGGRISDAVVLQVAIYSNRVLSRVEFRDRPLARAEQFCRHFNRINRSTDMVTAYQPVSRASRLASCSSRSTVKTQLLTLVECLHLRVSLVKSCHDNHSAGSGADPRRSGRLD